MEKNRLEAFSDGVIAIIITIMVLELKVPHGAEYEALAPLIPVFLSYILSFVFVGVYWNNHHHTLQVVKKINGVTLWANMHLLFWLSLIPFVTAWMGENHFATIPVALYGAVITMAGFAYYLLISNLVGLQGKGSDFAKAVGKDYKGKVSIILCIAGTAFAFFNPWIALTLYVLLTLLWFIPDRRMEKVSKK